MSEQQEITLRRLPSLPPLLVKAALGRRKPGASPVFPANTLNVDGITVTASQLKRYAKVCGFPIDSDSLPATYLHIIAFRLQMRLMTQADFPVKAMGSIHLQNQIRQYRDIRRDEVLSLNCRIEHHEVTDRGIEFTFLCQAYAPGPQGTTERVWEDRSLYLSKIKSTKPKETTTTRPPARDYANQLPMQINRGTALRYAQASGDFNPIHLSDISAKLLGFRKMIVHGMWSKAACIAQLQSGASMAGMAVTVEFKTPIFLPAKALLCYEESDAGRDFELRDLRGRPHLLGHLRTLAH